MSLLLRLWVSVAIYQSLVKLTYENLPNECRLSSFSVATIYCNGIEVEEAFSFIPSNITKLEFWYMKQNNLTLSFQEYSPLLTSLKLVNGHFKNIASNSLSGLTHLKNLDLANNKLSHLHQDSFSGLVNLQTLILQKNEFLFLNDVLPALFSVGNLTFLDLSQNLFETLFFEESEKLTNLTIDKVDLSGCPITNVDPLIFSKWNVYELHISDNSIDQKCLKNVSIGIQNSSVRILEMLKLSNLAFKYGESPLSPLYDSKIEMLTIGKNGIAFTLTFRSFNSLKNLQIIKSNILGLDMDSLLTLPNLEHLILRGNRIENLYVSKLNSNESRLKTLRLKDNTMPYSPIIPEYMFSSNLEELSLEKTALGHTITAKIFLGLYKLLKLTIFDSSIEMIEDGAFQDLESLKLMSLERNKLRFLRDGMFIGLHNLVNLYLGYNLLSLVSETSPFHYLTSLEVLNLKNNQIATLEPSYLANLISLEAVDFSNNQIAPWKVSVIPEGGNIRFLLLRSNKLNTVTPVMLKDFDGLYLLNLAENKFDCWDCSMVNFQQWFLSTNVTIEEFDMNPEVYTCHYPNSLKGSSIVTAKIDTEHCDLEQEKNILLTVTISCTFAAMILLGMASFKLRWHFRYCCYLLKSRVKRFREVHDSISYEYDAFVSYDPADCDWITRHLLAMLETDSSHIKFCLLDRDCLAGNDEMEEIFKVVQKCRKTLLVLSESYVKNRWCVFEMQMAQHSLFEEKRNSLILIQLHPINEQMVSANLSYLITTRTYIMWTDHPMGQKLFWKRLLAALAKPDTLRMPWIV